MRNFSTQFAFISALKLFNILFANSLRLKMKKTTPLPFFFLFAVVVSLLLINGLSSKAVNGQSYVEKYRLQLHYSVPKGWLNDPNGLVYHKGIYHLFYQHDPTSNNHGPMHWGHAQSTDLIHWQNMPIALEPSDKGTIFSGCAVVDSENVTGISQSETEPLIAIYTLDNNGDESQALAYSLDEGVTWTEYDSNPIVTNPDFKDFRDPNVVSRNGKYYMALAAGERILFYSGTNLKEWSFLSDFGVAPNQVRVETYNKIQA